MFSVVTRKGFEKCIVTGMEKAKLWAFRYFRRTGKAVRVIDIATGEPVAQYPQE